MFQILLFSRNIKNSVAGFLLLIFLISATPRKYLHDVILHHGDETYAVQLSGEKQWNNYKFCCGFINEVAITPFLVFGTHLSLGKHRACELVFIAAITAPPSRPYTSQLVRGPPFE